MDARQLFLARHAGVHSRNEGWWKLEDMVWSELPTDALRRRPTPEFNSIAWLVWHMARCEDVAVNTVLRGTQEVLDRDAWLAKLHIDSRHIGTGATPDEVEALSRMIDLDALRAYRAAVWCETRGWAAALDFETLNGTISPLDARRAADLGAFGEHGAWVEPFWATSEWSRAEFLFWLAIEHNWLHLGEIWVIRGLLHPAGT
jgi:hypothetical protein